MPTKEYKVQVQRSGETKWVDLYRLDNTVVEPFATVEAAKMVGTKVFDQHRALYLKGFEQRNHLMKIRIMERDIGDWRVSND